MHYLKADTSTKVVIGPVVAVGDGFTPVTTLSLSTADEAEILKHDAAAVTDISGNTFAAITSADGYYNLTITAAQLDTEGRLTVLINDDSLCLPVRMDFMVVNANVYDSLFAAATTDYLQVDTVQLASTTQDATDLADFAAAGYDPATNKVQGVVLTDTTTAVTNDVGLTATAIDNIFDEAIAGHLTAGTAGLYLALAGAILQDTTITGTPSSTTFQLTAGSAIDNFYNDKLIYIISGTGTGQARPILDYTGATKTVTVDEAWITTPAASDRVVILSSHVHPVTQITADIDANSTQLAAIVADTNELQTDWANGGRLDLIIDELTTQGDTNETKLDTIDIVVDAILVDTGTTLPATLGAPAGADMSADIAAVKTDTAAILVDTGTTLPASIATIDTNVDAILVDTGTTLPASIATIDTNVDSILVDTASIGITKNATFSNLEFLMVDETDHVTPETGLTVTGQMSIDGAAFASINGTIAEVSNGIYQVDLTAADTNGDVITYRFSATGAADRFITVKTRA